jgi:hypothetical protein
VSVLSGSPFFEAIFLKLGCQVDWFVEEGHELNVEAGNRLKVARVTGKNERTYVTWSAMSLNDFF